MSDGDRYVTKTVRIHEPERGRYVYLMVTKFSADRTILREIGYRSDWFQFDVMSQQKQFRTGNTAAYSLLNDLPEWFAESHTFRLISGLESGSVAWDDIADGEYLTAGDIGSLTGDGDE